MHGGGTQRQPYRSQQVGRMLGGVGSVCINTSIKSMRTRGGPGWGCLDCSAIMVKGK